MSLSPVTDTSELTKRLRYMGGVDFGDEAFRAMLVTEIINCPRRDVYTVPPECQWAFVQLANNAFRIWREWEKLNKEKAIEPVADTRWLECHEEAMAWREREVFSANEARKEKEEDEKAKKAEEERKVQEAEVEAQIQARRKQAEDDLKQLGATSIV